MKIRVNEFTGKQEGLLPATIVGISDNVLKNSKDTPYRFLDAEIKYPDGGTDTVSTIVFENSRLKHEGVFQIGKKIELAIQLEGEYAGRSIAQLPGVTVVDLSKFASLLANAPVLNTETKTEETETKPKETV